MCCCPFSNITGSLEAALLAALIQVQPLPFSTRVDQSGFIRHICEQLLVWPAWAVYSESHQRWVAAKQVVWAGVRNNSIIKLAAAEGR